MNVKLEEKCHKFGILYIYSYDYYKPIRFSHWYKTIPFFWVKV